MSRTRRQSRHRGRTGLILLTVLAVLAGGAVLYFHWGGVSEGNSGDSRAAELTVRYRAESKSGGTTANPWMEVVNTSDKTVALSDVTVRYYFTADDDAAYGSNCLQTSRGCPNITQRIGSLTGPAPAADRYLQIGFRPAAGSLAPGKSTEGIGMQLYRLDHRVLRQDNDRSFDAKATHYAPSKLVTAYLRGALAWGEEPGGSAPGTGPDAPSPAPVAAAPPAGIMFDSFRYSGPDDPALASNGWTARSDGGGPGIRGTWSAADVSFPAEVTALGGQALRLRVTTDGTKEGTRQSELQSTRPVFFTGTIAARVYFGEKPTAGRDGDHINESFFTISPPDKAAKYGELDYEYMPNGGWGAPGPRLDTTSWRSAKEGDRVTRPQKRTFRGWHTMMITAMNGRVTYSADGHELFSHKDAYFPKDKMGIHFSAWLIDLPFKGARTWDMKVNWVYAQAGRAVPLAAVQKAVDGFYADSTGYVNTLPES